MRERAHSLGPCRRGLQLGLQPGLRRELASLVLALSLSFFWPGSAARATSLVRLGLESMTVRAHCIAYATVEEVRARFADGAGGTIVTDVRLRVRRGLLGTADGELITIQHLGGVVGEIGQLVHGEARYRVGEEVVVLAARRPGGLFAVGMSQGALHVRRDLSGVRRVHAELAGAELLPAPAGAINPVDPIDRDAAPSGMPLDTLLLRLSELVARHHGAGTPGAPAAGGAR